MSKPIVEFKDRLKEALLFRGIRPIELSEKTGIPKAAISQYTSGYTKPKQDRVYLISKALGVNEAWLLGYDVPKDNLDFYYDILEKATSIIENEGYKTEEMYKKIFSNNLKRLMAIRQKTQTDLMKDLKLSCSTVSDWVNGISLPRMHRVQMLADYFNVEKSDLLEKKEITTIGAHKDNPNEDWTDEELKEIEEFKNYILSKRKNKD